jgi:hypothetical protein
MMPQSITETNLVERLLCSLPALVQRYSGVLER